jgi:hypothetical protein
MGKHSPENFNANDLHMLAGWQCREANEKKTSNKPLIHVIAIQVSSHWAGTPGEPGVVFQEPWGR